MSPEPLSSGQLDELLHRREFIRGLFCPPSGPPELKMLKRQEAIGCCVSFGAVLAGPAAREHNYGVCVQREDGWNIFFETGHA